MGEADGVRRAGLAGMPAALEVLGGLGTSGAVGAGVGIRSVPAASWGAVGSMLVNRPFPPRILQFMWDSECDFPEWELAPSCHPYPWTHC